MSYTEFKSYTDPVGKQSDKIKTYLLEGFFFKMDVQYMHVATLSSLKYILQDPQTGTSQMALLTRDHITACILTRNTDFPLLVSS